MTLSDGPLTELSVHRNGTAATVSRETVEEIYSAASLGWRQLWTGVEYAALKPLSQKKSSKRKA